MKKIKFIVVTAIIGCTIAVASCKKEASNKKYNSKMNNPLAILPVTNIQEIDLQLRELAKGFVWWGYHNDANKKAIHNFILPNNDYRKSTGEIWNHFLTSSSPFDIEDEIFNVNFNDLQSQIYLRDFFDGFVLEGCQWWNEIYIPDMDVIDTSKLHVVVPGYLDESIESDSVNGYYYNVTINDLDSMMITSENIDSFYVWAITSDNDCNLPNGTSFLSEPCNNNGICERWAGEDKLNCPDCNTPDIKHLYLWDIQSLSDWKRNGSGAGKRFQESWFSGAYEMDLQYYLTDGSMAIKDERSWYANMATRKIEFPDNSKKVYTIGYPEDRLLTGKDIKAGGRNGDIRKCKKRRTRGSKCKGSNTLFNIQKLISTQYDPMNDHLTYCLQEIDRGTQNMGTDSVMYNGKSLPFSYCHSKKKGSTHTNQFSSLNNIAIMNLVGPNENWQPITLTNPTNGNSQSAFFFEDDTDGEFRLTYVYFD